MASVDCRFVAEIKISEMEEVRCVEKYINFYSHSIIWNSYVWIILIISVNHFVTLRPHNPKLPQCKKNERKKKTYGIHRFVLSPRLDATPHSQPLPCKLAGDWRPAMPRRRRRPKSLCRLVVVRLGRA